MSRPFAPLLLLALMAGGAGCKSTPDPPGEVNITLINMNDEIATGAVLEFDRPLKSVELETDEGFRTSRLGEPSPWSVTLEKGALREGEVASFIVMGAEGTPEFQRGSWLYGSHREGPKLRRSEIRVRYPKEWPGGDPREKLK